MEVVEIEVVEIEVVEIEVVEMVEVMEMVEVAVVGEQKSRCFQCKQQRRAWCRHSTS
jgi:hypothetical protein